MGIDRAGHRRSARLQVGEKTEESPEIVALREAFSLHQPPSLETPPRMEEAVRGDQVDVRTLRPLREEFAQDPRGRALSDADAFGEADHVGHLDRLVTEERGRARYRTRSAWTYRFKSRPRGR